MRQVNSTDFKNHFGEFFDLAREEPIAINQLGRPVAVLISAAEFAHLQQLDELYRVARATSSDTAEEWIGHNEALALLVSLFSQSK